MQASFLRNIVAARKKHKKYRLLVLHPETVTSFPTAPVIHWEGTVPLLVDLLAVILVNPQSHDTVLRHLNQFGSYSLTAFANDGSTVLVVISQVPT